MSISSNQELALAADFVQSTGSHIFLTGKAGTGKTTFLRELKKQCPKQMIVTAPTGVAAINAGGVTLHSFFQLPFGPFFPGSEAHSQNRQRRFRFSREKQRIIRGLDLLVIDEISMVRADLLDAVDDVLRRFRRNDLPFGGVQLLMIGDLFQLPPVAKPDEWQMLAQYYDSVFFFSSQALARTELLTVELGHIYRQSDPEFIKVLNSIRDNCLDSQGAATLNNRYIPGYTPEEGQGYITLTTHNKNADSINQKHLKELPGKAYSFAADISGDFPEHAFPTPGSLSLKQGAQVMFLRNDMTPEKRYFNGKIGRIKDISPGKISILCPGEMETISVTPVEWENVKYTVNEETREIQQDVIGKFKQYPLKPAWAITIHKSQGLTFEKAVIDAGAAFTQGQVYVALSRCKTLEGMVLSSPVPARGIEIDGAIVGFVDQARANPPSKELLHAARVSYQQNLLITCFDLELLQNRLGYFSRLVMGNSRLVQVAGGVDLEGIQAMADKDIFVVSEKFRQQLRGCFKPDSLPEGDAYIQERVTKAAGYFKEKFSLAFDDMEKLYVHTDNKELGKRISRALDNLRQEAAVKKGGILSCEKGFFALSYLRELSRLKVDSITGKTSKTLSPDYAESDIEHPELFEALRQWRAKKASSEGVAHFQVMHQRALVQIVVCLPDNHRDLANIKGVGKKTIEKYGEELIDVVAGYRKDKGIEQVILPDAKVKPGTGASVKSRGKTVQQDTKQISFDLFSNGLDVEGIAKERCLAESTIQGHLCYFVGTGELDLDRLVPYEKQIAIEKLLPADQGQSHQAVSLKQLKTELGEDFSYAEIKAVLARQKHRASMVKSRVQD